MALALERPCPPLGPIKAKARATRDTIHEDLTTNRVLRFVQRPAGVSHRLVFYQFSGGLGPSAVAVDSSGNLYVTRYDFAAPGRKGVVSVISAAGIATSAAVFFGAGLVGLTLALISLSKFLGVTEPTSPEDASDKAATPSDPGKAAESGGLARAPGGADSALVQS